MSPTNNSRESNKNVTEAEFLTAQAADAQAAVHETWNELKGTLREAATLEVWARRHPWIVAGTAVAGGFLLATTVLRPKEQHELNGQAKEDLAPAEPAPRGSNWLIETLFSLLRPVLGQLVTSLVAAAMGALGGATADAAEQPTEDPPMTGGRGTPSGEEPVPT
jgi:hypothetical protein